MVLVSLRMSRALSILSMVRKVSLSSSVRPIVVMRADRAHAWCLLIAGRKALGALFVLEYLGKVLGPGRDELEPLRTSWVSNVPEGIANAIVGEWS